MTIDSLVKNAVLTTDGRWQSHGSLKCNPRRDNVPLDPKILHELVKRFVPIPEGYGRVQLGFTSDVFTGEFVIEWVDQELPQNIAVT